MGLEDQRLPATSMSQKKKNPKNNLQELTRKRVYVHMNTPTTASHLPTPTETSTAQGWEAPGLCQGSAGLSHAQGGFHHPHPTSMDALFSHLSQSFPPPRCRHAGAPAPCHNSSPFPHGRGNHLAVPSRHQMVPINFVHAQLASVNWKAQTPNILPMKQ